MSPLLAILLSVFGATALLVWLGGSLALSYATRRRLLVRASTDVDRAQMAGALGRLKPFLRDVAEIVGRNRWIASQLDAAPGRYGVLLEQAGRPGAITPREFYALKLLAPIVVFFVAFSVLRGNLFLVNVVAALLSFRLPDLWLRDRRNQRVVALVQELPDAMDSFALMMHAGLDLGQAIERFVDEPERTPLMEEFAVARAEMRLGKTRAQAIEDMARRIGAPDLLNMATAVSQAEKTGVALAEYMAEESENLRGKRFQFAEERGQKAPIKMMAPLMLLIMPCVFIVLFGPMALRYFGF